MVSAAPTPIVRGRFGVILATARTEQFHIVAFVDAEFGGGTVRSRMNWSMHTRPDTWYRRGPSAVITRTGPPGLVTCLAPSMSNPEAERWMPSA